MGNVGTVEIETEINVAAVHAHCHVESCAAPAVVVGIIPEIQLPAGMMGDNVLGRNVRPLSLGTALGSSPRLYGTLAPSQRQLLAQRGRCQRRYVSGYLLQARHSVLLQGQG
jgi:hypothetical protein